MLFPGGMVVQGKDPILKSLAVQPWASFEIQQPRVISLSETAVTPIHKVIAQRQGSPPYVALINSTYVLQDGTWKLMLHQQPPA